MSGSSLLTTTLHRSLSLVVWWSTDNVCRNVSDQSLLLFIFNQNYETSYGTSYLSLFQSFLIKLCCYPKSFNKIWKHHILDLHHNSSSTDGARFFLAVQSLESSVLLDIFWFFAKQLLTTVPLHLFVPEHFLWYPVFWELPPWN